MKKRVFLGLLVLLVNMFFVLIWVSFVSAELETISGKLEIWISEDFDDLENSRYEYFLNDNGERYRINSEPESLIRYRDEIIEVEGLVLTNEITPSKISKIPSSILRGSDGTIEEQRLGVILVNFASDRSEPYSQTLVNDLVFGEGSVDDYYREASYGKTFFTGEVVDWVESNLASGCIDWPDETPQDIITDLDSQIDYSKYDRLLLVMPKDFNCGFAGISTVGKVEFQTLDSENPLELSVALINVATFDLYFTPVSVHEIGHGFGLVHAKDYECGEEVITDLCKTTNPNFFDIMGTVPSTGNIVHFSSPNKDQLNWFDQDHVASISYLGGVYDLSPYETDSKDVKIIKIPVDYYLTPFYGSTNYYIEYRNNIGFDSDIAQFQEDGVFIHVNSKDLVSGTKSDRPYMLDMTPHLEETQDSLDVILRMGEVYEDNLKGIRITPVEIIDEKLRVNVEINKFCGNGIIDQSIGEECDGSNFGLINGCENFGFRDGTLSCDNDCNFDLIECNAPVCVEGDRYSDDGVCMMKLVSDLGDAYLWQSGQTWDLVRDSNYGSERNGLNLELEARVVQNSIAFIKRISLPFYTGDLPEASDILSADLTLRTKTNWINTHPESLDQIALVEANLIYPPSLDVHDYGNIGIEQNGVIIEGAERIDASDDISFGEDIVFSLNENGLSWINSNGWTTLGLMSGYDVDDQPLLEEDFHFATLMVSSNSTIQGPRLDITYKPWPCSLDGASWNLEDVTENQEVIMLISGINCHQRLVDIEIWEDDTDCFNGDDFIGLLSSVEFNGDIASVNWDAEWQCDGEVFGVCVCGDPEYYFKGIFQEDIDENILSSNELVVRRGSPFCGDGIVQIGEECDDGANGNDSDLCYDDCSFTYCGDNILQEINGEECDDGNNFEEDECSTQCKAIGLSNTYRVFYTHDDYQPEFIDGLQGADEICQSLADAQDLKGNWKAWLSTHEVDAADRLYNSPYPYRRIDGVRIADNWDDLITDNGDGNYLINPIDVAENGESLPLAFLWTGTDTDGRYNSPFGDCHEWNSNLGRTTIGRFTSSSGWTRQNDQASCTAKWHFYCFEQPWCGNRNVELDEQCDDGNFDDTDACSNQCLNNICIDIVTEGENWYQGEISTSDFISLVDEYIFCITG